MPDAKKVLITGGNAGIGYFVCEQLAAAGVSVFMGSRNAEKAKVAIAEIRERVPEALVEHVPLDLADRESIRAAADVVERLDAVVHNAGVYLDGPRQVDEDGNEVMFATNHLGHFALTHWLRPKMAGNSRIVVTGSLTARTARLDFDDLQTERDYKTMRAYARSKLAQMMFGFELNRRGVPTVVTHPGGALDSITPARPHLTTRPGFWWRRHGLSCRGRMPGRGPWSGGAGSGHPGRGAAGAAGLVQYQGKVAR
jgi:NAD(P)-dependent dehydrogenase (short-subunit alcohol dehydrogenase family)